MKDIAHALGLDPSASKGLILSSIYALQRQAFKVGDIAMWLRDGSIPPSARIEKALAVADTDPRLIAILAPSLKPIGHSSFPKRLEYPTLNTGSVS